MADVFSLTCSCGGDIEVTAAQAGSNVSCPQCGNPIAVPTLSKLRQTAGDGNPYLSAWGRMAQAAFERQTPFNDRCQVCNSQATVMMPLRTSRVIERSGSDDGGVSINPLFVSITVAGGQSVVESVTIPLLFCDRCHGAFRRWLTWETARLLILVPLLVIGGVTAFFFARIIGVFVFVILFVILGRSFGAKRIGRRWEVRLTRIPLVSEAIAQESEMQFSIGTSRPMDVPSPMTSI